MTGYIVIAEPPEVARVGRSRRAEATERRSTIDDGTRVRIVALADEGLSLRAIARYTGVSHETVRTILRAVCDLLPMATD